jgi:hypothetical protein
MIYHDGNCVGYMIKEFEKRFPIESNREQESFNWYNRAWKHLDEFRQKQFVSVILIGCKKVYVGIDVFASKLTIEEKADYIKSLLHGKGFKVTFNKNSETISIK